MRKAIELLAAASGRAAKTSNSPLVASLGGALRPTRDPDALAQLLSYRGWIYKAVNVRAARIAEIDLQVVDVKLLPDGTEERVPVPLHPIYDLLGRGGRRRPNPLTTSHELKKLLEMDLDLAGECFWVKLRDKTNVTDRGGIPRELWRVRPDRMLPVLDKSTGLILGWGALPFGGGKPVTWLAEDVIHFKLPNPVDPYRGMSPIRANAYAINIDQYNHLYQQKFFEQGALATVVLSAEGELTAEDAKEMLDAFKARKTGSENAWLPIVVDNKTTVTPISLSNKDLMTVDLFGWSLDEVLSIYGVSKTQLGLAGDVNLSNAFALDVAFNKNVIKPQLSIIEHQLEADLIPDYPSRGEDVWLEVDFENPVPGDREFELQEDTQLLDHSARTPNEIRSKRGDKPFDGPFGDMVMVPFGMTLIDPNSAELPDLGGGETETDPGAPVDEPDEEQPRAAWIREARAATPEERTAFWKAWSARATRWEGRVAGLMRREFARQAAAVLDALKKAIPRAVRVNAIDIDSIIHGALGQGADDILRRTLGEALARLIQREGAKAMALVSSETFDWKSSVIRYLREVDNRIVGINRTTEAAVRQALVEGVSADESIRKIAGRVREVFSEATQVRSVVIARTEVIGASNYGAFDGYRQGGAEKKGWLATRDERVRDAHAQADGQVVELAQPFLVDGEPLMYPGDPSGSPGNVIQCRCTVEPR